MTTITINISDNSVVDDLALTMGYLAVNPLTQQPNPKTKAEHIKDVLTTRLIAQVVNKRRNPTQAEADVKEEVEATIS
jgi:hypothetical protein